jgi:branched-chain amino acid transport system substrate-binding protein
MSRCRSSLASLGAVAVVTAMLAGCGDDGGSAQGGASSTPSTADAAATTPAAKAPAGAPIKIGSILATSGQLTYPDIAGSLKAAVDGVNARGGVGGRPLKLIACDEAGDPNRATACARSLIKQGIVAEVGGQSTTAEAQIGAIFKAAGIPQVGDSPVSSAITTQDNVFLLYGTGTPTSAAGTVKACVADGKKKIGNPNLAVPATISLAKIIDHTAKALGASVVSSTKVSLSTTDFAAIAQKMRGAGVDCVVPLIPSAAVIGLAQAQQSLGARTTIALNSGIMKASDLKTASKVVPDLLVASAYPVPTDTAKYPVFKEFQEDMARAPAELGLAGNPSVKAQAVNEWFAVRALAKVVGQDPKAADSASALMTALKGVTQLDLGLGAPWDPNKSGPASAPRLWSGASYLLKVQDGKLTPWQGPFDVLPQMGL